MEPQEVGGAGENDREISYGTGASGCDADCSAADDRQRKGMPERRRRPCWWVRFLVAVAGPAALWLPLGWLIAFLGFLILVVCFGDWEEPPTITHQPVESSPDQKGAEVLPALRATRRPTNCSRERAVVGDPELTS